MHKPFRWTDLWPQWKTACHLHNGSIIFEVWTVIFRWIHQYCSVRSPFAQIKRKKRIYISVENQVSCNFRQIRATFNNRIHITTNTSLNPWTNRNVHMNTFSWNGVWVKLLKIRWHHHMFDIKLIECYVWRTRHEIALFTLNIE